MIREPTFATIGDKTGDIDVRLSYRIVELFSEGLYTSPNKAIEELVANSFDAGARRVHVLLSPNLPRPERDDRGHRRRRGDGPRRAEAALADRHQQQAQAAGAPEGQAADRQVRDRQVWRPMCLPIV